VAEDLRSAGKRRWWTEPVKGVSLIVENCVMEGWHPDGYPGRLAYSPELWEWMSSLGLYLSFDPFPLGVDGHRPDQRAAPVRRSGSPAQARDIEIFPNTATATVGRATP
jgi:hypothetical protein